MKLRKRFETFFTLPKVQKQLVFVFLLVLLIPIAFCSFLLYDSQKSLHEHYTEQAKSDNLRVKSIMFDVTTNLYNVSQNLYQEEELLNILNTSFSATDEAQDAIDHYTSIYNIMYTDTSISSINIYTFNDSIGNYGNFCPVTDEIERTDWFSTASKKASVFWQTQSRQDVRGNTYWELTLYRKIPLIETDSFAVLSIAVSDNYLRNRIDNNTLNTILTINKNPVFYSDNKEFLGSDIPADIDYETAFYSSSGTLKIDDKDMIAAASTLHPLNSDDQLYIISYDTSALTSIQSLIKNYILTIIVIILIPCIVFFIYSQYFSARILVLRKAMNQASRGNYEIMDSFTGKDELSETFQDLRIMIEQIKEKEAEIYQAKIREQAIENRQQQMEFKMLASQINPHFLYNTLETIRMKAFTAGDREAATAIKLLGKSLRYVLENTGTVSISLEKEINHIRNYIAIQRLRFGDRVNLKESIMQGIHLDEYKILPLLLQPIVENSILHGLEGIEENGLILLEILEKGPDLCICISDNGNGMDSDTLEQLREKIITKDETRTRSIGLYNINQRLKLCYGPSCQLHIDSKPGQGTSITMKIPLFKIKEATTNESSYCR